MASTVDMHCASSSSGLGPSGAIEGNDEGKQTRRRLCPHCLDIVSRATYFRHKHTFYDYQTKQWKKSIARPVTTANIVQEGGDSATPLDDGRCLLA